MPNLTNSAHDVCGCSVSAGTCKACQQIAAAERRAGAMRETAKSESAKAIAYRKRAMKAEAERDQWRTSALTGLEEITKLRAENTRLREDLASAREGRNYAD